MATNKPKTQAERAASTAKTKSSAAKTNTSSKKGSTAATNQKKQPARSVPARLISSVVFLCLFILFLVVFFAPEGAILTLLAKLFQGLFGKAAFIISIPAFLYLFLIFLHLLLFQKDFFFHLVYIVP